MIKRAIRIKNRVRAVDEEGAEIPEYTGSYEEKKESILRDASSDTEFIVGYDRLGEPVKVPREVW